MLRDSIRAAVWLRAIALLCLTVLAAPGSARAQSYPGAADRYFTSSDGVRLHYLEAGSPARPTLVLVPGWTMPAWIWGPQITAFSRNYRVIAFDPRGQGLSEVAPSGYQHVRRGQDIADLIEAAGARQVVVVGWSLGVLDTLAYVHEQGDRRIAGLVLVDNSVGEEPAPVPSRGAKRSGPPPDHEAYMRSFVQSMFRKPQDPAYLEALTDATLVTPVYASRALLAYPVPRTYWREAVYASAKPVLYAVRPAFYAQAMNLQRYRPNTEIELFAEAGHALFVDEAFRFNALVQDFLAKRVWP